MKAKEKAPEGMKVQEIDPHKILIPPVRITSEFDPEIFGMFQNDIEKAGIEQPLILADSDGELYVIDGMHRLEEAKLRGLPTVPCVIRKMDLKELQMRNLVLNRLRGKTKVSEEVAVIMDLFENHGSTIEELVERTGIRRDRVEMLISIGSAGHEVWEALDQELIRICHAFELARLPDPDVRSRALQQCIQFKPSCPDWKDVVDDTLNMLSEAEKVQPEADPENMQEIPMATCQFCEGKYPIQKLSSPIMCMGCYGFLVAAIQETQREAAENALKSIADAAKGAEGERKTEGGA